MHDVVICQPDALRLNPWVPSTQVQYVSWSHWVYSPWVPFIWARCTNLGYLYNFPFVFWMETKCRRISFILALLVSSQFSFPKFDKFIFLFIFSNFVPYLVYLVSPLFCAIFLCLPVLDPVLGIFLSPFCLSLVLIFFFCIIRFRTHF